MDDKKIAEELLSLARGTSERTKMGRLRDLFDAIEATMKAGVGREAILKVLASGGLEMTIPVFDNAMSRIRKSRKTSPQQATKGGSVKQAAAVGVDEKPQQQPVESVSSNDAKKNLINAMHDVPDLAKLARIAQEARKRETK